MSYQKPRLFYYRTAQIAGKLVSKLIFRCQTLRNEIKDAKGPFVVIANHQSMLDFVNLIGATRRPMSFVISKSFFRSLPLTGFMEKMGVIPKQQFQTAPHDLKQMKAVIGAGEPVVIYPAGLMCEDGLSTPIPSATYKFLKWLGADVYAARTQGSYFVSPKWTSGFRPGRTTMDIYKLFDKYELATLPVEAVAQRTDEALLFDAYAEQELLQARYKKGENIEGLEQVLYLCPHCKKEFTMTVKDRSTITCQNCGYTEQADSLGFLHKIGHIGTEIRHVSDWSRYIREDIATRIANGHLLSLSAPTEIRMILPGKHAFTAVGEGTVSIAEDGLRLCGKAQGQPIEVALAASQIPSLPFSPGKHIEIQDGDTIYRCVLKNGRLVMKLIHMLQTFHQNAIKEKELSI